MCILQLVVADEMRHSYLTIIIATSEWECPAYSNNRSVFINSLSIILCSDFYLMSAFEKTRYIFDQSVWECNGHFDHWFLVLKY